MSNNDRYWGPFATPGLCWRCRRKTKYKYCEECIKTFRGKQKREAEKKANEPS